MIDKGRSNEPNTVLTRYRWIILASVALLAVAVSAIAILLARHPSNTGSSTGTLVSATSLSHEPFLLFRSTALNRDYGTMELTSAEHPGAQRALTTLKCETRCLCGRTRDLPQRKWREPIQLYPRNRLQIRSSSPSSAFPWLAIRVVHRCLATVNTAQRLTS